MDACVSLHVSDPGEEGIWFGLTGMTVLSRKWCNCYDLNVNETSATSISELGNTDNGCFFLTKDSIESDQCSDDREFICQYKKGKAYFALNNLSSSIISSKIQYQFIARYKSSLNSKQSMYRKLMQIREKLNKISSFYIHLHIGKYIYFLNHLGCQPEGSRCVACNCLRCCLVSMVLICF